MQQEEKPQAEITAEHWDEYLRRYDKLMWSISYKISGDTAIAELGDNYADLCMAAVESIHGFHRKTGYTVDQMFEDKRFDGYTKTCLWHKKDSKGAKITKKFPLTNKTFSISSLAEEGDTSFELVEDESPSLFEVEAIKDFVAGFSETHRGILRALVDDPSLIMNNGRASLRGLSRHLKMPIRKLKREIDLMEKKFNVHY